MKVSVQITRGKVLEIEEHIEQIKIGFEVKF